MFLKKGTGFSKYKEEPRRQKENLKKRRREAKEERRGEAGREGWGAGG